MFWLDVADLRVSNQHCVMISSVCSWSVSFWMRCIITECWLSGCDIQLVNITFKDNDSIVYKIFPFWQSITNAISKYNFPEGDQFPKGRFPFDTQFTNVLHIFLCNLCLCVRIRKTSADDAVLNYYSSSRRRAVAVVMPSSREDCAVALKCNFIPKRVNERRKQCTLIVNGCVALKNRKVQCAANLNVIRTMRTG